ncbi:MAG: acetyl-CoA synthase subunit gamma, partial [Ignavibacteriae bacterium]
MNTSEQKCGCGKSNELVSLTIKNDNRNECQSRGETAVNPIAVKRNFVIGAIETPAGTIPRIATRLEGADYLGAVKVRWGINRSNYRIEPGLYAVGSPTDRSDVFVTANYKLTFDIVRKNLAGINAWLMVLDTKGINVWCAAGKGTFGTKELVNRIQLTLLEKIVQHRRIILPQLGAVGVAAHQVKDATGFTVLYGPVRASDIAMYVQAGYKTTKEMRRVRFGWADRIKLVPNDFIYNLRYLVILLALFFILSGIHADGFSLRQASTKVSFLFTIILAGYLSGVVLTPLLLPYLFF